MRTNNVGLLGSDVPNPAENAFVIGIFGGSVAAQLAGLSSEPSDLENVLNKCFSNSMKLLMLAVETIIKKTYPDRGLSDPISTFKPPFSKYADPMKEYTRFLKQFAAIASVEGVEYFFVLQPSPLYKQLSREEERVVINRSYNKQYDVIDNMFHANFDERYLSLKDLFKGEAGQVFFDDIHLGSYGNHKLAVTLAEFLSQKSHLIHRICEESAIWRATDTNGRN